MQYLSFYLSPLGNMFLTSDDYGLTSVGFSNQRFSYADKKEEIKEEECAFIKEAKRWLDIYFSAKEPDFTPHMHLLGTEFQKAVWSQLLLIPYGKVVTYGEIADKIAKEKGIERMSARAVGGAVGHNPISIIVPCHRVIGSGNNITGYGGGIERKKRLLSLEGINTSTLKTPKSMPHFCSIPIL